MFLKRKVLPPYFPNAVGEVSRIEKQDDQNRKIEPEKSIPFPEKETNPGNNSITYFVKT